MVRGARLFLEGRRSLLVKVLKEKMGNASKSLRFEEAARLRDQIEAVGKVTEKQKITSLEREDQDYISYAKEAGNGCVGVFLVREGKLINEEHFLLKGMEGVPSQGILTSFLKQYYHKASSLPKEVILPEEIEDKSLMAEWLSEKRGSKVKLIVPKRGEKRKLLSLVEKNAKLKLEEFTLKVGQRRGKNEIALMHLKDVLHLPALPLHIEAFDVSNLGGKEAVGSMVSFEIGEPKKEEYRQFKIKSVDGIDDYAMIQEVVGRRYKRVIEEGKRLPDLILIDGGKGHLSAARKVLKSLERDIPIFGLAKQHEHIFLPNRDEPVSLPSNSPALHLIQHIRDEAHRFAIRLHRKLRVRRTRVSILDGIPGIGKAKKKLLLRYFGSVDEIKRSSVDDLAKVRGINRKLAEDILSHLC